MEPFQRLFWIYVALYLFPMPPNLESLHLLDPISTCWLFMMLLNMEIGL